MFININKHTHMYDTRYVHAKRSKYTHTILRTKHYYIQLTNWTHIPYLGQNASTIDKTCKKGIHAYIFNENTSHMHILMGYIHEQT